MRSPRFTVISLGGGVQSSVMALMANEGAFDRIPDCAIFADTRWEPPSIYEHLTWLRDRLSFPLYVVDNGHGDSILRLDRQSLKVLRVSGVKYDSEPLNVDHYVSLDPIGVRFASPTAKVTVFRRHQYQETGQVPVEVEPDIQTSS